MDTDANPSDSDYVIDDVKDIIRQYHPVCVALQETFLKSCHTTKIRRYGCVQKDTEGPSVSGGVCIFTSLEVPSSVLPLHTSLQAVTDLYNSDHFPIILSHDYDTGGKTFPPTYSYSCADWALFTQLAVIPDAMIKAESVDIAVQEVTNVLIAAADLSIPKSSSHSFQHYKPWWNTDCQTAYKNQRKL
ncbi:putative RNA-directed DNA polymerase from transposon X-element [Trichonephila clavipes]|nr:putative RNA-directed DNA polymerase from transposon X-element [Trichonephila clavipes]